MIIHKTLSMLPQADETQRSLMCALHARGKLDPTIHVSKNPRSGNTELVDGRTRLSILGKDKVVVKTVAWDDAAKLCLELNTGGRLITQAQRVCLHYTQFGQDPKNVVFPEKMLDKVHRLYTNARDLFDRLLEGTMTSVDSAIYELRIRDLADDDDDEGDDPTGEGGGRKGGRRGGRNHPPVPGSRDAHLEKMVALLRKARSKFLKARAEPADDPGYCEELIDEARSLIDDFFGDEPFA
jgi:hypothetical protein